MKDVKVNIKVILNGYDPQEFVDIYVIRHAEKYNGEQFEI